MIKIIGLNMGPLAQIVMSSSESYQRFRQMLRAAHLGVPMRSFGYDMYSDKA